MHLAKRLIDEAKRCGVDAVKFQAWTPSSLYSGQYLHEHPDTWAELEKNSLSVSKLRYLAKHTEVDFICSVFSRKEVDELEDVVDLYKIASMDVTNHRLLKHVAEKKKPVIISSGMSDLGELLEATDILDAYNIPVTVLYCVSLYPPRYDQINLNEIVLLRTANWHNFNVGYSDHTTGITIPLAAVALGADCIEKHFTLDKNAGGWDDHISADPVEMASLVEKSKQINESLNGELRADTVSIEKMRRSVVYAKDLKKRHRLTDEDIIMRRPGTGLSLNEVIGRKLRKDVYEGQHANREDLRWKTR